MKKHIYNLLPTPHGHKFHSINLKVAPPCDLPLPPKDDLRESGLFDTVYNQGNVGSCTGNGAGAAVNYELRLEGHPPLLPNPARLFIYFNEREIENKINEDSGATLGDCMAALQKYGVCDETLWPYDPSKFAVKPINEAYASAITNPLLDFNAVHNVHELKHSIANKKPVVIGVILHESFESENAAKTGIIPIPADTEERLGGHCMLAVGYDDEKQWVIVRNSWGEGWGDKGHCYIPYAYFDKYLMEAYTLQNVK